MIDPIREALTTSNLPRVECYNRDNEFGCVAEGCIEKTPKPFAHP
jgi:hypothetical protein